MTTDPTTLETFAAKWTDRPVTSEADAREFVDDCERLIGGGFHPDTRMWDYVIIDHNPDNYGSRGPTFSDEDADVLDERLGEAFTVVDEAGTDIYAVSLDLFHKYADEENGDG